MNSRRVANAGPTVSAMRHEPVVPDANVAVTIRAEVADPDGVDAVQLQWRTELGVAFQSVAMTPVAPGIYEGQIPGQAAGRVAQFFVEATDAHGGSPAVSVYPAAGEDSRAMVEWQDNQADTTTLQNIRVVMRPADRQTMRGSRCERSGDDSG